MKFEVEIKRLKGGKTDVKVTALDKVAQSNKKLILGITTGVYFGLMADEETILKVFEDLINGAKVEVNGK